MEMEVQGSDVIGSKSITRKWCDQSAQLALDGPGSAASPFPPMRKVHLRKARELVMPGPQQPCGLVSWAMIYVLALLQRCRGSSAASHSLVILFRATYFHWAPGLLYGGDLSHLSTLCEPLNFQDEQKVLIHSSGIVILQLSFGPLQGKILCCSLSRISHNDI